MANDRQIILLAYGSNGVSRVEMGRLLASGPATVSYFYFDEFFVLGDLFMYL
jgi:hypothetical protein